MQRTMSWRFRGRLTLVVHGPKNPSNLEWRDMLRDEAALGIVEDSRTLIVSYGGGPDGAQRELLSQQMVRKSGPTAIMTKSPIVRAITAALLFFNRSMKVFSLEERKAAHDFLALSAEEREWVDRTRAELEHELGTGLSTDTAAP
jgi:hypothetical protein